MSHMEYIRKAYGVPAKRGGKLLYTNAAGLKLYCTIRSATVGGRLRVSVDTQTPRYGSRFLLHPTWNIEYLMQPAVPPAPTFEEKPNDQMG